MDVDRVATFPGSWFWGAIMANYIEDDAYCCLGGFDRLVAAVRGLEKAGGNCCSAGARFNSSPLGAA